MKKSGLLRQISGALSLLTQLGVSMGVCILVGVVAGKLLDDWLGTSPWLLIVFSVIGAAAAFKTLYEMVIKEWIKK